MYQNKEISTRSQSSIELKFRELKDMISQLNNTISAMTKIISDKDAVIAELTEEVQLLRKKIYGSSRERSLPVENPDQLSIVNLLGTEPEKAIELVEA